MFVSFQMVFDQILACRKTLQRQNPHMMRKRQKTKQHTQDAGLENLWFPPCCAARKMTLPLVPTQVSSCSDWEFVWPSDHAILPIVQPTTNNTTLSNKTLSTKYLSHQRFGAGLPNGRYCQYPINFFWIDRILPRQSLIDRLNDKSWHTFFNNRIPSIWLGVSEPKDQAGQIPFFRKSNEAAKIVFAGTRSPVAVLIFASSSVSADSRIQPLCFRTFFTHLCPSWIDGSKLAQVLRHQSAHQKPP